MKANQKFRDSEDAVSPVIAVILMVAITVVLAATVYVWVSGFGASTTQPAKTIALTSNAPIVNEYKSFVVSAATPSLRWNDVTVTIDGEKHDIAATQVEVCDEAETPVCTMEDVACSNEAAKTVVCQGTTRKAGTALIAAGDEMRIPATAGQTLRILDAQANSVILTVTLG